jgi:hypothetical protein
MKDSISACSSAAHTSSDPGRHLGTKSFPANEINPTNNLSPPYSLRYYAPSQSVGPYKRVCIPVIVNRMHNFFPLGESVHQYCQSPHPPSPNKTLPIHSTLEPYYCNADSMVHRIWQRQICLRWVHCEVMSVVSCTDFWRSEFWGSVGRSSLTDEGISLWRWEGV